MTGDNIYKVLIYFDKLYSVMEDFEKRQLLEALISEIQIHEEQQPNGQWLKSIKFKLPIIEEDMTLSLDNNSHVETVVLLSREKVEHQMKLNAAPFEMIKNGRKTIELRLWDEKRQKIEIGDTIVFTNTANGEKLEITVLQLHRFKDFEELYQSLPLLKCGYTEETIGFAKASDMDAYYSVADQAKYGVVGIELSPLNG